GVADRNEPVDAARSEPRERDLQREAQARVLVRDRAAARHGRVSLLVGPVARADERAREDGAEAERLALLAEPPELVGMHPAVDRRVLRARLQVLADGDDVDAVRAQVPHRLDDLGVRLAEPD